MHVACRLLYEADTIVIGCRRISMQLVWYGRVFMVNATSCETYMVDDVPDGL